MLAPVPEGDEDDALEAGGAAAVAASLPAPAPHLPLLPTGPGATLASHSHLHTMVGVAGAGAGGPSVGGAGGVATLFGAEPPPAHPGGAPSRLWPNSAPGDYMDPAQMLVRDCVGL